MTSIRDPDSHHGAGVNGFGQLLTEATTNPEDRHINIVHNKVWSLPFEDIDPVAAGDYFLYIKNTGTVNLIITDLRVSSTVVGHVDMDSVAGTPAYVVGTDIAPVNRYFGSSNEPDATMKTDTDITGLTDQGFVFRTDIDAVGKLSHLRTTAGVILPPGQAMALKWSEATGALSGTVSVAALV